MALAAAGLNTAIWNNNIRSILLLLFYPLIIMFIVWLVVYTLAQFEVGAYSSAYKPYRAPYSPTDAATGMMIEWWPAILGVIGIWFTISYFLHTKMIRALSHARPVTRSEEPELYNLLENLCIASGMKMPRLEIIETHARNAFASGIDDKSYAVTVTRGLMNSLKKDELEGVLAHELTHIINRDVRLMMVCIIFTGMIGFAAQMLWSSLRYNTIYSRRSRGRGRVDGRAVILILSIAIILWLGYLATLFTRFALSRRREFMADAGAVEITKNPDAMMRALMRIAGADRIPEAPADIAMMCIENAQPFFGVFATHPPIQKRIETLSALTGTPVPVLRHTGPAAPEERFGELPSGRANPWLSAQRGDRKNAIKSDGKG